MPKLVQGDSARVVQIFTNLISNSIKFTTWSATHISKFCQPYLCSAAVTIMKAIILMQIPKEQIQNQMHQKNFLALGGQGNSHSACLNASCMARESFALPSHPKCIYVNRMSKLHAHITFWVMSLRLSMNAMVLPDGAEALMCVPSMTPTHFY